MGGWQLRAAGLATGALLDGLIADPARLHPVAGFGKIALAAERRLYADSQLAGAAYFLVLVVPTVAAGVLAQRRAPIVKYVGTAAVTWAVLGGRSLRAAGTSIAAHLSQGDLAAAREALPTLCGRDPASLDAAGIARAAIESIAENTSDAIVAPLLWGAVAGMPGLLGYRAVNTLDAMVGHRSPRFQHFGTAAARADDVANLVPARFSAACTVLVARLVGGSARAGVTAWRQDAARHPSPNAGRCEASMAGVLGVQLGGLTTYAGRVEHRPLLGSGRVPHAADLTRSVTVSRAVQLLATCAAVIASIFSTGRLIGDPA